jgi:2-methylisocitrate lyase-like PEP mutase family enzyme
MSLRAILAARTASIPAPGCWDGFSAFLIEEAGFPIAFLSGGALSMARFGKPDMGFVSQAQLVETVATIRDRTSLPLIVDADTGFGNALNVKHTVRALEAAGASAIQLEDQTFPKRCGHMAGKGVIPAEEAAGKIKAAVDARRSAETLIVARTDAVSVVGFEPALERAEAFLEAGADLLFIEGPRTIAEMEAIRDRFAARAPLVHNLVEGGVSPAWTGAEMDRLGVALALHPLLLLHRLARTGPDMLAHLKAARETRTLAGEIADLREINARLGAPDLAAAGKRYDEGG